MNFDFCTYFYFDINLFMIILYIYLYILNSYELTNIEEKDPVSLLFAHLYYGHNSTGTFEDIIYELCDIVDDILIPYCKYSNNIKFELSGCTNKNHINRINYLNCRTIDEDEIPTSVDCNFIIHNTFKGYVSNLFTFLTLVIEIAFLVLLIMYTLYLLFK